MKVIWVTRSFLDYRIPVYKELSKLFDDNFKLFFNEDYVPKNVVRKAYKELGTKCIGLRGELTFGKKDTTNIWANSKIRIPFQPGLIKHIKKEKPDIIISDGFFQWTYAALWIRLFYRIPHIMCYERTEHTERNAQWYRKLYRKIVIRWIDAICCSGKLCGEYVQNLGFSNSKITYGHMVGDIDKFSKKSIDINTGVINLNLSKVNIETKKYLYVGRIVEAKGLEELLNNWSKFQELRNVALFLVGEGKDMKRFKNLSNSLNLKKVFFMGRIDYEQLPGIYRAADYFIIPTLEDNWSLVVPEAMASGLPILTSKYNGCWPEYITQENGWVFDPINGIDFEKALILSYNEKSLKKFGDNSLKIISKYTPQKAAKAIFDASLLASNF